ncbi:putative small heat shock protein [Desulfovibrio sp. DV]|uniref:Hsp20/alpha crystallin family protein n=1 Tax=Desulfovibrio sp. DV TaxID=1844708 RepID=UPI00094BB93D|nr:Hsp20/alpha crystallin family protein [Desulfovibrio sp. DV]OLN24443.1 putative small heat shock protein [Desulfovibrio sp. DV]
MAKLHWTPWMALAEIGNEAARMMDEAAAGPRECAFAWQPAADVVETDDEFRVTLELAGVAREDVAVEIRGRELIIQGNRRFEKDARGGVYQVLERSYGPFARSFLLPKGVARTEIAAVMKDGLLEVRLPKVLPERLRRRIPIS